MWNYLKADSKRFFHKKSTLLFILIYLIIIGIMAPMASYFNWESFVYPDVMVELIQILAPTILGISLYDVFIIDDLRFKSEQQIIGKGIHRLTLIITKLIEIIVYLCLINVLSTGIIKLGADMSHQIIQISTLMKAYLNSGLLVISASCLSFILLFGMKMQKGGSIFFNFIVMRALYPIVMMILGFLKLEVLNDYLLTPTINKTVLELMNLHFSPIYIQYLGLYVLLPLLIAYLGYRKKELDF